jgi:hypothetical protein
MNGLLEEFHAKADAGWFGRDIVLPGAKIKRP